MDACFSAKRYRASGKSVSLPVLDKLYYLPTPERLIQTNSFSESCSNFRAGDERFKAIKGLDVSAIFAAVCVHGFAYKLIGIIMHVFINIYAYIIYLDVAKGEALDYSIQIIREFKKEFPKAKLTVAYDIACRMKCALNVIVCFVIIIFNSCFRHQI